MKTSGITPALPAQDLDRARAFYVEKVGLRALESDFLKARDGQVGLTVGDGVSQLFVYPARRPAGPCGPAVVGLVRCRCCTLLLQHSPAPRLAALALSAPRCELMARGR